MARTTRTPQATATFDRLARRIRATVREVHVNELSGIDRFQVRGLSPFTIGQVQGELVLEDGDPDFTVGEGLRTQLNSGIVALNDLVWVARHDQEWHALDTVGAGAGFKPSGAAGGDLGGAYPNPSVVTINGRAVSAVVFTDDTRLTNARTPTGTAGGDFSGTYPNPSVASLNGGNTLVAQHRYDTGVSPNIASQAEWVGPTFTLPWNITDATKIIAVGALYDGFYSGACSYRLSVGTGSPGTASIIIHNLYTGNANAGWRGTFLYFPNG